MYPQTTLSKKYKVEGIPTLVLLDADKGTVLSKDGRNVVLEDPEGKDFPWMPKPFSEIIKGKLIGKEGAELQWEDCAGKVIGLYFSAHWVSECVLSDLLSWWSVLTASFGSLGFCLCFV